MASGVGLRGRKWTGLQLPFKRTRHWTPNLGLAGGDEWFNEDAALKTGAVLVPVDSFAAACAFGPLAVELLTTTGMPMNESMQIRLDPDCFVCLEMPAPPGGRRPDTSVVLAVPFDSER